MRIAKVQGAFNILAGLWPLISLKSFEAVSGKKEDEWLVMTVAWLFVLSGLELWKSAEDRDVALLGLGWAAIIGGADIYYSAVKKRISKMYLFDAVTEALIIVAWANTLSRSLRK
jgi:hypothetical protein